MSHNSANAEENEEDSIVLLYRKLVKRFCDMRRYQTALFWAESVAILSRSEPKDVYCMANCMFLLKQYNPAAYTIHMHKLENVDLNSYNLLLECLYKAKNFDKAIVVINSVDIELLSSSLTHQWTVTFNHCRIRFVAMKEAIEALRQNEEFMHWLQNWKRM
uniref:Uncharacterized protein n=1 Tax=Glossina brevipalpis TaxID=37001 RepID=A0A1A9X5K7_9MUSC